MTKADFLAILEKHLNGTATDAERRLLDEFYHHHSNQPEWTFSDKERIRVEVFEALNRAIDEESGQHRRGIPARVWRIAASIAVLIAVGVWLYLAQVSPPEVKYLTETTRRGEQRTVSLPDGSVVRLNAESSITFPEQFTTSDARDVELTGEGFFDVTHNEAQPFIVRSGNLLTTVLGTTFNIRAYPEDKTIAVTVATGQVKIEPSDIGHQQPGSQLLRPGEQGVYDKLSTNIARAQVETEKYLAWKEGTIVLEGASLEEATAILGRWYDVEFVLKNPRLKSCMIDGKFRNDKLENILENLRFLMGIDYRIEPGNRIIIDGVSCH